MMWLWMPVFFPRGWWCFECAYRRGRPFRSRDILEVFVPDFRKSAFGNHASFWVVTDQPFGLCFRKLKSDFCIDWTFKPQTWGKKA